MRERHIARTLLYVVPTLIGLWFIDNSISRDRYAGYERNSVRNSQHRWAASPKARVAILGSSTSKDWLPASLAARLTGVRRGDVLDAHINGCHQDCTWASVRLMRAQRRRFDVAFIGTNLFQLCEHAHTKRILQQSMQLPTTDIPRLFGHYTAARQPLRNMGRFIGVTLSGAYGDSAVVRRGIVNATFGRTKPGRAHLWYRADHLPPAPPPTCAYGDDDIAYKARISASLLDDLGRISKHVILMMLPDRTRASTDPAFESRWAAHMALHRELADAREYVTLVDLVTDGVSDPTRYRDGFHLNRRGIRDQRILFERRMKSLGWPKPLDEDDAESATP